RYGDGITIGLAVDPRSGLIYVGSGHGVEVFNPQTETFTHYSRDLDLRVGSLAFDGNGNLWATTWPDRTRVVKFNERARAETMFTFDTPIDSLAFGKSGTTLENLLFVTHNSGPHVPGSATPQGSELTMIDLVTLRRVAVAKGGTRGDNVITTSDGRVLISQSSQVDVLTPLVAPVVVATNPPRDAVVALPLGIVSVVFNQDMFVADRSDPASVLNPANFFVTEVSD